MAASNPVESGAATEAPGEHQPFVPDSARIPEFTIGPLIAGTLLGIVFGASSLYLTLKVGMTVSASIPVAVLSITLFRVLSRVFGLRPATILENNIVQTTGSAGESIAFGVGVTMPALMILGFEMDIGRVMVVAILGGVLGILMMIPLRRAFIVRQHGTLKYPEGTACADVLIVGEEGGASAKTVFTGFGLALAYQVFREGMGLWKEAPSRAISWFKGAVPAIDVDPALLGVGYIIGTRIASVMAAGGVLAWLVMAPAIHLFGDSLEKPLYPATDQRIRDMDEDALRENYILYIGAGAVAAGGIFSLVQSLPLIVSSLVGGIRDIRATRRNVAAGQQAAIRRTDRDMPLSVVVIGSLFLVAAIAATSPLHRVVDWIPELMPGTWQMSVLGGILIVFFGFFFVTVSSRLTGEIGSSSNPISGMTVATLLLTCLIFYTLGQTAKEDRLAALSVAAIVCIAASNGGTTSQDLKTGYLVGATPVWQQWAILIGAITSSLVIGGILIVLNQSNTYYSQRDLPTLKVPIPKSELVARDRGPDDTQDYFVWQALDGNEQGVQQGKYLVEEDGRKIHSLADPGINGRLSHGDKGEELQRFKAPKARLMALIADGILNPSPKMPWALVLLGVFIAVVLEMCGVPSLAFAVGVYLPLSTSVPVFVGGLVRYVADRSAAKRAGGQLSEAEAEMSPGVLLSTGYIAGGTIAGIIIALLVANQSVAKFLNPKKFQYRAVAVAAAKSQEEQIRSLAEKELDYTTPDQVKKHGEEIDAKAKEIEELNTEDLLFGPPFPVGTELKVSTDNRKVPVAAGKTRYEQIRPIAEKELDITTPDQLKAKQAEAKQAESDGKGKQIEVKGLDITTTDRLKSYQAAIDAKVKEIEELNREKIKPGAPWPEGAEFKVPQHNWPALVAFGVLVVWLLVLSVRGKRAESGPTPAASL